MKAALHLLLETGIPDARCWMVLVGVSWDGLALWPTTRRQCLVVLQLRLHQRRECSICAAPQRAAGPGRH